VGVPVDDLPLVHDVAAVDRVLEDVVDVAGPPGAGGHLAGVVGLGGWAHALAGQPLGDAPPAVVALVGDAEDAPDHLEVLTGGLGDHELLASLDLHRLVAERRGAVGPEALGRLGGHPTLHVLGQLLGVALREPGQDGPDQLLHRAIPHLVLGQGDDLDVGVVQGGQGAQAVEHVAGDAGEGPDVEPLDAAELPPAAPSTPQGLALGLGPPDQPPVAAAAFGGAPADALVHEPVLRGDHHPIRRSAALDLGSLLLDGLVLLRVTAPQIGGSDSRHGSTPERSVPLD